MNEQLRAAVRSRMAWLERERVIDRIWERDFTVWKPDPKELADRLGWLSIAAAMQPDLPILHDLRSAAMRDGFRHILLLGMGGSSLGPEVMHDIFGPGDGGLTLEVLDSTHPAQIRAAEAGVDLDRTLFLVSSKSGTTLETMSHLEYYWERFPDGRRFVAVTDPGTALEVLAAERGFRRIFTNPPDLGGRYSVLSYFGLVPGALMGAPIGAMLADAEAMALRCRGTGPENPGAALGVALGEAALAGRDKCTLLLPPRVASFGWWVEQLVAESTGKEGRGILPVEGEPPAGAEVYGEDRVFVAYEDSPDLGALERAGHPVIRLEEAGLGGEFFRWEFATAVAGAVLGVQPFDQPNVQEVKDLTAAVLRGHAPPLDLLPLAQALETLRPGDYIAINAFVPRDDGTIRRLNRVRAALRDRYRLAVTVGFGPRYLHSTGQFHKGGPATGLFIEVIDDVVRDIPVPGRPYTFGGVLGAQATADLVALRRRGLRASRLTIEQLETAVAP